MSWDIDISKAEATTILSCGTTLCGHYAFVQQGLSQGPERVGNHEKKIFDILKEFAPIPPGEKWELFKIDLQDYKSSTKFHRIHAEYFFTKPGERAKYSKETDLMPEVAATIYKIFSDGMT